MSRHKAIRICLLLPLVISAVCVSLAAYQATLDNPQALVIEGLSLETISRAEIEHTFGKALTADFSEKHGVERICYTDSHGGDTTLEFEIGEVGASFRLFHSTVAQRKHCAKSSIVEPGLTIGNGLKLALSKSEVDAILGKPTHSEKLVDIWESSKSRDLTAEEIERFKSANPSASPPSVLDISTRITIHFENSRATSISVSHSEST